MSKFKTQNIREKLKKEGNFTVFDKNEHIKALTDINESLENFRRDFRVKDRKSQRGAGKVTLTA